MTSQPFAKIEGALKAADNLVKVGSKFEALKALDDAIRHRKWKNNWTKTHEEIMLKHLALCVELKKMNYARDGLHQYKTTCQAVSIQSLEAVVRKFREAAEEKVNEAQKLGDAKAEDIDDLDEHETPETIMLRAIQGSQQAVATGPVAQTDVHVHFKFLWETYKAVLDVVKSHPRLEEVYHDTVQKACEFLRENKRPIEFKRLSDTVKRNWEDLAKPKSNSQNQVNPNNTNTIVLTLDTRFTQLRVASELDLWREAYSTAERVCDLLNALTAHKVKGYPKPKQRSSYYEYLAKIFWKSENYLFHAFACLKNVLIITNSKRDLALTEKQALASKAVMATLCILFQRSSDSVHSTLELAAEDSFQKAKKHAALFNAQAVPTRETIIQQLGEKALISFAIEPVKKLFELIESDFTPLSLCQDAKPYLEEIATVESLQDYVTPVKKIIFLRLMKQLSEVYANMTIENFERAASIVPFSTAEKWMANAARQQGINIQINYREKAIVFGATRKVDMKSMKQPLIEVGYKLQQAMQRIAPEELHKKEKFEKQKLLDEIDKRMKEELQKNRQRKEIIEQRKEDSERLKAQRDYEAMEKLRKEEMRTAEEERKRQLQEREIRAAQRQEEMKEQERLKKVKEQLEKIKEARSDFVIDGKKVINLTEEEIKKIDAGKIEAARDTQVKREQQNKVRDRKNERKRVDHVARAFREEERSKLDDWQEEVEEKDNEILNEAEDREYERLKEEHGKKIAEKKFLSEFASVKEEWMEEQLKDRYEEHLAMVKEQTKKNQEKAVQAKIQRARDRKEKERKENERKAADKRRQEEDEKRRKREEERRQQEEQEEAEREAERIKLEEERKQEEDAKREKRRAEQKAMDEMRERAEAKRKAREAELEAKAQGRSEEPEPERRRPERQEKPTDDTGSWRRGADEKDTGSWRSSREDWKSRSAAEREELNVRSRGEDEAPKERPRPAWKRDKEEKNDEGSWRQPKGNDENPWNARRDEGREREQPRRENAWANRKQLEEEDTKTSRPDTEAAEKGDDSQRRPVKPAVDETVKTAEAEDDDGFTAVVSGKKKKNKEAGAEEAEPEKKAPPPWKRSGDGSASTSAVAKGKDAPWKKGR
mmetsp:Transcript_114761/g.180710  ORF Transcript_114761/g.180710 Transcript_114761/m.180710 type:complete len:1113 (+) Transcript_114761:62-3400(+)